MGSAIYVVLKARSAALHGGGLWSPNDSILVFFPAILNMHQQYSSSIDFWGIRPENLKCNCGKIGRLNRNWKQW